MKLPLIAAAAVLAITAGAAPWHHPLAVARGGVWTKRVSVTIENRSGSAAAGDLVETPVPALAGERIEVLRVCDEAAHELLFDVRDHTGASRHDGSLDAEDRLVLPVECAAHAKSTLYVYAANPRAKDPGEYLPAFFSNGGFETRTAWEAADTDSTHRATIDPTAGRNRSACAKVEIDPSAEPKWTKWSQSNLRVEPGRRYRVSGWVRAEKVVGEAGWFLHVNGEKPMLINQSLGAGDGTFEWKRVEFEFTAPPGAKTATFGTLLRGTGTAWYDDAEFAALDSSERWHVALGPLETLELDRGASLDQPNAADFSDEWPERAVVRVLNLTDKEAAGVVTVDLRPIRARLPHLPRDAAFRISGAGTSVQNGVAVRAGDSAVFLASVPPRSERLFYVHFSRSAESADSAQAALLRLLQSPANLAPNPTFETDGGRVRDWQLSGEGHTVEPGHLAARALELKIPPAEKAAWNGWRSKRIPVEPRATYLFSAFAQAQGLVGRAPLYAHIHDAAGRFTPSRAEVSSAGSVTGDSPWTALSTVIETAPEAHDIELHLTTNATAGRLRHDGVFFCRALAADLVRIENAASVSAAKALSIWQVNPLVKIFADTPPGPPVKAVAIECARNEYEPFELVLRSSVAETPGISVSPLTNESGETLPPVKVDYVGYVPVDHPSAYYRFDGPTWHRPIPNGQGGTDGWAGDWPDPLIPASKPPRLEPESAQPVWFTAFAPASAAPGEYHAKITVKLGPHETTIPLAVRVHPFELPAQTHLKVILDWRWGRGGDYDMGKPELKRKWLELMRDHRLGLDHIDPAPVFTYHAGKVRMDASAFDDSARQAFDRLGLSVCYLPQFFYSFGWAYPAKEIFGLKPFTPEYNAAFQQAYKLMSDHLREMGWHDRFVYYVSDEPHYGEPHVVEQMMKLCALAHEVDPSIPIYSSTWTHFPKWDDSLDIWGAGHHGIFPVEEMRDLQARRKHIWFTCDGQMAIDTPYLATERTLPYYCHKYGAEGFEFWGLSWWTIDPWTHGWHSFITQSDDGKKYYSTRYPDGDGYLTYPGGRVGIDGPVSSIRLEQMREGIEDYEALRLLEKLMAEARGAGRNVTLAEHALTAAHDLVTIPNSSGLRTTENLPDPDKLPAARKLVNAAIVSLLK